MLKKFYPYEYVESVFSIDYQKLYDKGYKGVIFDIDNTLVHHGEDSTREVNELFKVIQNIGLKTLVLSNNNEARVKKFLENIESLYICDAEKPDISNYLKSLEMLDIKKEEAVVIGDQIFTDIWGARRLGIYSILVQPINKKEEIQIVLKRIPEKWILHQYRKRG